MSAAIEEGVRAVAAPARTARATVLAAAMLTVMAPAVIAPSLPAMREVFAGVAGADVLVRLVLTITSLAIGLTAPLAGMIADRIGRKPLLVTSLALFAVAGVAGFFVDSIGVLLVTRALVGVAVGGIMTAVSATITDWFEGPKRAAFLGLQQAFASIGGVMFLPLAGLLAASNWQAPFWIYAVSLAILPFALFTLREQRRDQASGVVDAGPSRSNILRPIAGLYLLAFLVTLAFYMAPTQLPFLLAELGTGPAVVGMVIAATTLSSVLGALAFSPVRVRWAPSTVTAVSVALLGFGWVLVGTAGAVAQVVAGLLVGGFGVGLAVPNLNLRLSDLAPAATRGRILSGLVTGIFLGQFVSPLIVQPLIRATGIGGAFLWTGLAMTAGAALALPLFRKAK
ncbi:MFS transporter [Nocardia brasiliensis]|uniref:MFS transporter n=1 Tax=Nocardia brasiliensis TaxID=37326 RepID=A0A6G9XVK5_NOCBR|nr:MFS transporter [Nocardia brasiliensis]QIS04926.1 MFS transporter [Nocardia brasiliensis]